VQHRSRKNDRLLQTPRASPTPLIPAWQDRRRSAEAPQCEPGPSPRTLVSENVKPCHGLNHPTKPIAIRPSSPSDFRSSFELAVRSRQRGLTPLGITTSFDSKTPFWARMRASDRVTTMTRSAALHVILSTQPAKRTARISPSWLCSRANGGIDLEHDGSAAEARRQHATEVQ